MKREACDDLDYLTTRLHARRSRMAEGARLGPLCGRRTVSELGRALFPESDFSSSAHLQRRLVNEWIRELDELRRHAGNDGQDFLRQLLVGVQVENLRLLLRGVVNQLPFERTQPLLALLPDDLALDARALAESGSVGAFAALVPAGRRRDRLVEMLARQSEAPRLFLLEAALDSGYHQELLEQTAGLPDQEGEIIRPLVLQESNCFLMMLALRGRFQQDLPSNLLSPLRISSHAVSSQWFERLLASPDVPAAAQLCRGMVLDDLPVTINLATVEALARTRLLRLANSAFRRSHNGLGAVVGYAVLRRMEVANLITLSEGIRLGLAEEKLRARLAPRSDLEVAHV